MHNEPEEEENEKAALLESWTPKFRCDVISYG